MDSENPPLQKMDWMLYFNRTINIIMKENYGVVYGNKKEETPPFYEIVFKTGKLVDAYEEGLLLDTVRDNHLIKVFVPFSSIKCVEIY